jgi:hypothetical protein
MTDAADRSGGIGGSCPGDIYHLVGDFGDSCALADEHHSSLHTDKSVLEIPLTSS